MASSSDQPLPELRAALAPPALPPPFGAAKSAHFVTRDSTVLETLSGARLPGIPPAEAERLNALPSPKADTIYPVHSSPPRSSSSPSSPLATENTPLRTLSPGLSAHRVPTPAGASSIHPAPQSTSPLFPSLPVYGPPTFLRTLQYATFRFTSGVLSCCFLLCIVTGAVVTSLPDWIRRLVVKDPDATRPGVEEERMRGEMRAEEEAVIEAARKKRAEEPDVEMGAMGEAERLRMESGGRDKLLDDIRYYANRIGLEAERLEVETEDGFLLDLWHVWDPEDVVVYPSDEPDWEKNHQPEGKLDGLPTPRHPLEGQESRRKKAAETARVSGKIGRRRYPVLLMHGLLQSAGAFCVNDEDSLAFYLTRCGYDVWLSNSRCGPEPRHRTLAPADPRMWAWNIREMAVLDIPAFISHILHFTGFPHLSIAAHSQGTTQMFLMLSRPNRPDLGRYISTFSALAPAVYAGPLVDRFYFKFMRIIPEFGYRLVFGIHSFIPLMLRARPLLHPSLYGSLGYLVFRHLFGWNDTLWDRGLCSRFFQFAPVYISSESMRWWLGKESFAKHRCIFASHRDTHPSFIADPIAVDVAGVERAAPDGDDAWFGPYFPKLALYIAGQDGLVDGEKLLNRFKCGAEPMVDVVKAEVCEGWGHLDVLWAMKGGREIIGRGVAGVIKGAIWESVLGTSGGGKRDGRLGTEMEGVRVAEVLE